MSDIVLSQTVGHATTAVFGELLSDDMNDTFLFALPHPTLPPSLSLFLFPLSFFLAFPPPPHFLYSIFCFLFSSFSPPPTRSIFFALSCMPRDENGIGLDMT